uniref:Hexosyltransferase n=1 Tax=Phlebotomus kandelakii TaxID=1109342 RepID=A0A6B2E7Y3_9DIPT
MLTVALVVTVMLLTRPKPRPRVQLLNLIDFHYVIDQGSCEVMQQQPLLLILVHSAPANQHKRRVIRETWGAWRRDVRTLFLLGAVGAERQVEVELEAQWYGDVIQGSFLDTYRNLTYKHAMALHWSSTRCPEAHFLLKADDDIFVNTPAIVDFLTTAPKTAIMCTHLDGNPVLRNVASVW